MSAGKQIKSFGYAFQGIFTFFKTERNGQIHLIAALIAIGLGVYLELDTDEWLWVSLSITLVIVAEMINTAIEKLCNRITTDHDPQIKVIKDISAGFVLLCALFSLVVAAIIFVPKLF
jgi:diacylglycerol kinase (ATP)